MSGLLVLWMDGEMRSKIPSLIKDVYLRINELETIRYATSVLSALTGKSDDPGYHGTVESQLYLAEMYYKVIKETWKL